MKKVYISGPMRGIPNCNSEAFASAYYHLIGLGYTPINPAWNFGGDQTLPWETYMQTDISQLLSADAIALLPGWQNSTGALVEVAVALATGKDVMDAETLEKIEGVSLVCHEAALEIVSPNFMPGEGCCGMSEGIGHTCDDCPDLTEPYCCGDPGDCGMPCADPGSARDSIIRDRLKLYVKPISAEDIEEYQHACDSLVSRPISPADDHPLLTPGGDVKIDTGRGGSRSVLEEAIDITSGARQASYGHPSEHYERTAAMWTAAFGAKRGWHFNAEDVPLLYMLDKISREINLAKTDNLTDIAGYARVRQLILEHLDNNPPF
jgi:hypothetical protein